jgi:predicted outer membrane protein
MGKDLTMKELIRSGVITIGFLMISMGCVGAEIPVQHTDAEILGVLSAVDQNEIQAAQLAEQKFIVKGVLDYAKMLDMDHNKHLDDARRISQELGLIVEDDASLDQIRTKGGQDLAALTALDGEAFAQLYIADVIKEYSETLNWMNSQSAQNQQLKAFLTETRNRFLTHFDKAQEIQEKQQTGKMHS